MKLYYDPWQELWYQNETPGPVSFGSNRIRLPFRQEGESFSVDVNVKNANAGPLIGILASMSPQGTIVGNTSLFTVLQRQAIARGGLTIVFPPEGIDSGKITGCVFDLKKDKWFPVSAPLPHVVYNRVPLRKTEKSQAFREATTLFEEWNIPFFNPSFIDKYDLYEIFSKNPFLGSLLPETIKVDDPKRLEDFLKEQGGVYLKPALSSRGSGLYILRSLPGGAIELESHTAKWTFPAFDEFWGNKKEGLLKRQYIAQSEVEPAKLDGNRFDFRIHIHDSPEGYKVTGVGIRHAQTQNLTTHLPNGGIIIPYEKVRTKKHDLFIKKLAMEAGNLLSKHMGYFGEFSIDAGITESGNYVLYEVNSKPMAFDEAEIENTRIQKLLNLLFRKSGF
jgi:hypothetical protein